MNDPVKVIAWAVELIFVSIMLVAFTAVPYVLFGVTPVQVLGEFIRVVASVTGSTVDIVGTLPTKSPDLPDPRVFITPYFSIGAGVAMYWITRYALDSEWQRYDLSTFRELRAILIAVLLWPIVLKLEYDDARVLHRTCGHSPACPTTPCKSFTVVQHTRWR